MSSKTIVSEQTKINKISLIDKISADWKVILLCIPTVIFVLIAIFGPMVISFNPMETHIEDRLLPPGASLDNGVVTLLGTDSAGRDVLMQIVYGARISLLVAAATVLIGGLVGMVAGMISGFFGGLVDTIIMRIVDIQLSFPSTILAILFAGVLGPSVTNIIITLSITRWVIFARVARSATLAVKSKDFVDSARVIGMKNVRLLARYILPSCLSPLLVIATVQIGLVIISEASLSFLGLGTTQAHPSWGLIIANGRDYLSSAWWISTMPGIALAIVVVSVGFLGDKLRDKFDTFVD
ncbi:ABC transporter permease [Lentibacillus sp. N15]|uniref:ABC transporter permease n=1 Tax=Lentibacillus songyuanensis TaxID=3136161 RepID=UPI0031BB1073